MKRVKQKVTKVEWISSSSTQLHTPTFIKEVNQTYKNGKIETRKHFITRSTFTESMSPSVSIECGHNFYIHNKKVPSVDDLVLCYECSDPEWYALLRARSNGAEDK